MCVYVYDWPGATDPGKFSGAVMMMMTRLWLARREGSQRVLWSGDADDDGDMMMTMRKCTRM